MKKKMYIITLMVSFLLIPQHFVAAQTVFSFTGGQTRILHYGYGIDSISCITDTDWVLDSIDVITTSPGASCVLDQYVYSDLSGTSISRNALYIGPGSIDTSSTYKPVNQYNPGGEGQNSITGISITGDSYGALIQNGSLEFNATFGGIRESVAVAGNYYSTYSVEQFGFVDVDGLGDFTPLVDYGTSVSVSGEHSATILTFDFGSSPQPTGPDTFNAEIISWATGDGIYSFTAETPTTQVFVDFDFGTGNVNTTFDFDTVEGSADFKAN